MTVAAESNSDVSYVINKFGVMAVKKDWPRNWTIQKLKRVCRFAYGDSLPSEVRAVGSIRVLGSNGAVGLHTEANTLGPCIVIGRKGSFGKVNYADTPIFAIDTTYFVDSRFTKSDLRWLFYALRNLNLDSVSKDSAVPGLAREDAYERELLVPPLAEQRAIARFLDRQNRRIDRFIRAKRKLIALLNEQKQAIIHHAVTRGLDPDVPLKPSGIPWLGDIPAHWEIRRAGRLFSLTKLSSEELLPLLEVTIKNGVQIRDLDNPDRKQMMADFSGYQTARADSIAYNMMRCWQGAIGVVPEDGLVSPAYVVASPCTGVISQYFVQLLRTSIYMREIENQSRGIVPDRNRLYWDDFKQLLLLVPPRDEQTAIVSHLEQVEHRGAHTIDRALREVALLNEYRTRLIADAVTGQTDVRAHPDAAEQSPEDSLPVDAELLDDLDLDDGDPLDGEETADAAD
jgi:type I restriction enzyme, S subunit